MNPVRWWATPSSHNHDNVQCTMMSAGTVVVQCKYSTVLTTTQHPHPTFRASTVQDDGETSLLETWFASKPGKEVQLELLCICLVISNRIESNHILPVKSVADFVATPWTMFVYKLKYCLHQFRVGGKSSSLVLYLLLIKWQIAECSTWSTRYYCQLDSTWLDLTWLSDYEWFLVEKFPAMSIGTVHCKRNRWLSHTRKKTQSTTMMRIPGNADDCTIHWGCSRLLIWFVTTTVNRIQQRNNVKR